MPIDPFAFDLSIFGKFEILGIGVLIGALSDSASRGRRRSRGQVGPRASEVRRCYLVATAVMPIRTPAN